MILQVIQAMVSQAWDVVFQAYRIVSTKNDSDPHIWKKKIVKQIDSLTISQAIQANFSKKNRSLKKTFNGRRILKVSLNSLLSHSNGLASQSSLWSGLPSLGRVPPSLPNSRL